MYPGHRVVTFVLITLLVLAGCISAPKSRPFNAAQHDHLRHIEVLPMRKSELNVAMSNNTAYYFGLVGALAAEAHLAPRRNWLREQAEAVEFDHVETFADALAAAMADQGYTLSWPNGRTASPNWRSPRNTWGTRKNYPQPSDPAAQALLDVNFAFVGLASSTLNGVPAYRPSVVVTARLMDTQGRTELFQQAVVYNDAHGHARSFLKIDPDPTYAYEDFDALKAAGAEPVEGLRQAFQIVAGQLAQMLAPQTMGTNAGAIR